MKPFANCHNTSYTKDGIVESECECTVCECGYSSEAERNIANVQVEISKFFTRSNLGISLDGKPIC